MKNPGRGELAAFSSFSYHLVSPCGIIPGITSSSPLLPAGGYDVMPGDNVNMVVELICPIAMDEGLRFAIREGGRTVGAGVVSKVID